jgi:mRNA-degrading endonuclease RelE of RelBE toxin-antitoxin system
MSPTKTIIFKAMNLKPTERFIIIDALIRSLDAPDPRIEKAWLREAQKRLKAYKSGKLQAVLLEDVFGKKNWMKVQILRIAWQEFLDAKEFYELEQPCLGARFEKEIKHSLLRIKRYPSAWPAESKEIRRNFLHKFPYKVLYSVQKGEIIILAFAHLHRKPDYWADRIK